MMINQFKLFDDETNIIDDSVNLGELYADIEKLIVNLKRLQIPKQIEAINHIKTILHKHSPFKNEPVDCVLWVKNKNLRANDYNPNTVAPPEMKLLEHSISMDGYTQPIVSWPNNGNFEVVDGFHRFRIGQESLLILDRCHGYLPITVIQETRIDRNDRIAATIRHNRARGKHQVSKMSDIVVELKRRNWSDEKIGNELGMDKDEVLRLCQITGLLDMFDDEEFSKAWEAGIFDDNNIDTDIEIDNE